MCFTVSAIAMSCKRRRSLRLCAPANDLRKVHAARMLVARKLGFEGGSRSPFCEVAAGVSPGYPPDIPSISPEYHSDINGVVLVGN